MDQFETFFKQKSIKRMIKQRDLFVKDNLFITFGIFYGLLFLIDYFGCMDLYDQNFVRRLMNMNRRTDSLSYSKKLKPFCEPVKQMLDREDIQKLQSIRIPNHKDQFVLTRQNTTTHQCCEKFSQQEQDIITEISEKVRKKYEKEIGKKLYYMSSNKATIYVYHGKNAKHLWHVDPQNLSEIHNVIICIKKIGDISPLQCKDINGTIKSIGFEEGDAAIFNGGTTEHQVPPNKDDQSERTVLSISFTTDLDVVSNGDNMCTYLEGGNNYLNMIKLGIYIFILTFILTQLSGVNRLSYTFLFVYLSVILLIVKYIPLYFDTGLGSGRASSIYTNLVFLFLVICSTLSVKGAIVLFSYFLLSDVFFIRSWVAYD